MTVIIEKSVCADCAGLSTCQRVKRLNYLHTIRDEMEKTRSGTDSISGAQLYAKPNRPIETFEIIIINCSMKKQYNWRKSEHERNTN